MSLGLTAPSPSESAEEVVVETTVTVEQTPVPVAQFQFLRSGESSSASHSPQDPMQLDPMLASGATVFDAPPAPGPVYPPTNRAFKTASSRFAVFKRIGAANASFDGGWNNVSGACHHCVRGRELLLWAGSSMASRQKEMASWGRSIAERSNVQNPASTWSREDTRWYRNLVVLGSLTAIVDCCVLPQVGVSLS